MWHACDQRFQTFAASCMETSSNEDSRLIQKVPITADATSCVLLGRNSFEARLSLSINETPRQNVVGRACTQATQHVGVCFVQPARRTGRPRGGSQPPFRNGPLSGDRPGGSNGTKCSSSGDAGCGVRACDCHSNSRLRVRALAGGLQTFHMCSKGNANASTRYLL